MRPLEIAALVGIPWTLLVAGLWLAAPSTSLASVARRAAVYLLVFAGVWLAIVLAVGGGSRGLAFDIGWTLPWIGILAVRLASMVTPRDPRPFKQVLGSAMASVAAVIAVFMMLADLGAVLIRTAPPD